MNKKGLHQLYAKPILFVGLLLLLAGIYSYTRMQTNLFLEVLFPRITVIADAGQQPVDRMMITVTKPLESAVKKVPGTTVVKSSTSRGSCVIDVYFRWGLDIYALKTQLENRINEIKNYLPAGTVISNEAMNQSLFPVYGFTLEIVLEACSRTITATGSASFPYADKILKGWSEQQVRTLKDVEALDRKRQQRKAEKEQAAGADRRGGSGRETSGRKRAGANGFRNFEERTGDIDDFVWLKNRKRKEDEAGGAQ